MISDPLIRNRATLGGSLAEANPRGAWPPVVLAAGATVHLRGRYGERVVPVRDFFTTDGTGFGGNQVRARRIGGLRQRSPVPHLHPRRLQP